jgi:cytochrome b pre-mRNA-processing protein 3
MTMLGFLFRGLTAEPNRGAALFGAINAQMRQPHWYVEGKVPDTLDGRFAVLATLTALALVRIEQAGDEGNAASVALTEQFIEVMESEHRELGLGDPKLGRTVRKLVGSLSRRVELWRETLAERRAWNEAVRESLYKEEASPDAILHSAEVLRDYWAMLGRAELRALVEGKLG